MSHQAQPAPPSLPHLVSVPAAFVPSAEQAQRWGQVALRVDAPSSLTAFLSRWRGLSPIRRLRIPVTGGLGELLSEVGPGIRVDCVTDSEGLEVLARLSPAHVQSPGPVLWVVPQPGPALEEVVRQAGLAGWPVALEPAPWVLQGGEELLAILDFYLFHPDLRVPVEPLHSLFLGLLGGRPQRLWEIWFGAPRDHFYVSPSGAVSLSETWAAKERWCYGTVEDSPEVWRASAPHGALEALLLSRARADAACETCEAAPQCGGALISLDPKARCEIWREMVARLRLAAASLAPRRARPARPTPARTGS